MTTLQLLVSFADGHCMTFQIGSVISVDSLRIIWYQRLFHQMPSKQLKMNLKGNLLYQGHLKSQTIMTLCLFEERSTIGKTMYHVALKSLKNAQFISFTKSDGQKWQLFVVP